MLVASRVRPSQGMSAPAKGTGTYSAFSCFFSHTFEYSEDFLAEKFPNRPREIRKDMEKAAAKVTKNFAASIRPPAGSPDTSEVVRALDSTRGSKGALTAAAGAAFEVGVWP